ncbi:MAG TPA: ABC transporter substrate-binding protein [Pseudolabrys sp.]|nr:ABC transporter substrate-binding protein [Pseudolabrys sp.]
MKSRKKTHRVLRGWFRQLTAAACLSLIAGFPVHAGDISRIVSIGGAVTEILYDLGKEQNIVGIDTTSLYPPRAATEKPSVGYMRQLSAEGVLGLRPTLILAIENSGPKDTMAVLDAAHVPLVVVPDNYSEQGIIEKIRVIAKAAAASDRADCLINEVNADLAALARLKTGIAATKRVMFILSFANGRALVAGRNTAADGIIRMAGAQNAVEEYEGYKPVTDEAVIAAKPGVVLTMQRNGPGVVTANDVFSHAAFAATPAAADRSFISMEGLYLLGFGPRSARAARDLATALYPQLKSEALPSERISSSRSLCRE